MRTIKLASKNEAAKWMTNKVRQNVKNYAWDFFYDIKTVLQATESETNDKVLFYWGIRKYGTWIWQEGDLAAEDFALVSDLIFELTFDPSSNAEYFLTAKRIK